MKRLLRLALATDFVALMTVVLGSWTRINSAGLTCPDWPLCRGHIIPLMTDGTLWEWTHRLLAFMVAPLMAALVAAAWPARARSPFVGPTLGVIVALFIAQVLLGAATVRLGNAPFSVVVHWGTAMAFIAALSAMAVFAAASLPAGIIPSADASPSSGRLRFVLATTTTIAFITMCIGAYVSSSGAGLACLSIQKCAGNVIVHTPGEYVQMLHRAAAAATLLFAAAALALAWAGPASARVRGAAGAGVALVCIQVVLGLLNVTLRLPVELREAHAVNAAFLFLAFFIATVFATLDAMASQPSRPMSPSGAG
jgi:heme A synthase